MNKFLLLSLTATMAMAQNTVNLSLGEDYANNVFYKFEDNSHHEYKGNNWDIAFYRNNAYNKGIRLNHSKGLFLYELSNDPGEWDNISLENFVKGEMLNNSDEDWLLGAFDKGSAAYGWGAYNSTNHHIEGKVIFLIETLRNDYYKIFIEDYYYGYTFKYSMWNDDSKTWGEDKEFTIPNSENPNKFFNYFNIENEESVEASPDINQWDLKFARYLTLIPTSNGNFPYIVTGVLQNPNVKVAQVQESVDSANHNIPPTSSFSDVINTIGYDWKHFSNYSYEIVPDNVFYLKSNDKVYRFYFTSFSGKNKGNLSFVYEEENLSTLNPKEDIKFAISPNPVTDNQITIVYENSNNISNSVNVELFNIAGQKVFETELSNAAGFFQKTIQLNDVDKGLYIIKITSGEDTKSEKLIIE